VTKETIFASLGARPEASRSRLSSRLSQRVTLPRALPKAAHWRVAFILLPFFDLRPVLPRACNLAEIFQQLSSKTPGLSRMRKSHYAPRNPHNSGRVRPSFGSSSLSFFGILTFSAAKPQTPSRTPRLKFHAQRPVYAYTVDSPQKSAQLSLPKNVPPIFTKK
jgi:hypothetical protein